MNKPRGTFQPGHKQANKHQSTLQPKYGQVNNTPQGTFHHSELTKGSDKQNYFDSGPRGDYQGQRRCQYRSQEPQGTKTRHQEQVPRPGGEEARKQNQVGGQREETKPGEGVVRHSQGLLWTRRPVADPGADEGSRRQVHPGPPGAGQTPPQASTAPGAWTTPGTSTQPPAQITTLTYIPFDTEKYHLLTWNH